ncbi:TPA: hypothetical protein ACSTJY_001610 [Serratia fonticola]|uniref:hypothetical protein n=1 Tax=Serratia fonticola TaxID=47917 RepID=UPI00192B4790|nr:hypothetical protein [Serratia fonticola]MBL5859033.1 hypothetical protein [Serratia fonticola]CAI2433511.1 Uncharacterised protein [Serratia fonticola]
MIEGVINNYPFNKQGKVKKRGKPEETFYIKAFKIALVKKFIIVGISDRKSTDGKKNSVTLAVNLLPT